MSSSNKDLRISYAAATDPRHSPHWQTLGYASREELIRYAAALQATLAAVEYTGDVSIQGFYSHCVAAAGVDMDALLPPADCNLTDIVQKFERLRSYTTSAQAQEAVEKITAIVNAAGYEAKQRQRGQSGILN